MTLLELILALALSAILMIAIGMAIDLHLRALDSQRSNVEEAQLSRAVLHRVRDDLRSTMQYEVVDFSVVEQLAAGAAVNQAVNMLADAAGQTGDGGQGTGGQGLTGGGVPGGTGQGNSGQGSNNNASGGAGGSRRGSGQTNNANMGSGLSNSSGGLGSQGLSGGGTGFGAQGSGARGATGLATSGGTASMQSGSRSVMQGSAGVGASGMTVTGAGGQTTGGISEDIAGGTGTANIPGLYGNQYELQIDVSRLPRLDEYNGMMDLSTDGATSATRIPSDVKTVAYYLKTQDSSLAAASNSMLRGPQTGLVRRELDRAVTSFATASGGGDELVSSEKVLAPEVTSLEFQYYDGQAWTTSWDSDVQGGLPVAIEIVLGIASPKSREQQRRQAGGNVVAYVPAADDLLYRLVVKLPVGKPIVPATTEEATDPTATQTGTTPGTTAPSGTQGAGT